MDLSNDDLLLHCIIKGESEAFPVNVQGSLWHNPKFNVGHLKEKMQEKRKDDSLAGVCAHSLVLWKVHRRFAMSDNVAYFPVLLAQRYQSH